MNKIVLSAALVLATLAGVAASSYAAPSDGGHGLGYTRDQSVNGG